MGSGGIVGGVATGGSVGSGVDELSIDPDTVLIGSGSGICPPGDRFGSVG